MATILFIPIALLIKICFYIIKIISSLSFAYIPTEGTIIIFAAVIMFIIMIYGFVRNKKVAILAVVIIAISANALAIYKSDQYTNINILSVGDGQSIIVRNKNEVTVIDCGSSGNRNAADSINKYMIEFGITEINNLIITSIDKTHVKDILDINSPVLNVVLPEKEVRQEANELVLQFVSEKNSEINGDLPDYIDVFAFNEKKLVVNVQDTLILHAFTNKMLTALVNTFDLDAKTVVLSEKVIEDYYALENVINIIGVEKVFLSNANEMSRTVSGVHAKTTMEFGNINIKVRS